MSNPVLRKSSRLLMFAPHPDDESLATGVLLQKAVAAGAAIRVIYVTDGDNNPWPQRALEKRWRLSAADRVRWGARRRAEALAALQVLGVDSSAAHFMGLRDQRVTEAMLHHGGILAQRFGAIVAAWKPTLLVVPSQHDTHPDHSAVNVLTHLAIEEAAKTRGPTLLTYLVHGNRKKFELGASSLEQTPHETVQKRRAVARHFTQVKFSRRRFMAYAARLELFANGDADAAAAAAGPITIVQHSAHQLRLRLHSRFPAFGTKPAMLYVVGRDHEGAPLAIQIRLSARTKVQMTNCANGHRVGLASCRGRSFAGDIELPIRIFAANSPLFVKLARRRWFFDEAGWNVIPALAAHAPKPFGQTSGNTSHPSRKKAITSLLFS